MPRPGLFSTTLTSYQRPRPSPLQLLDHPAATEAGVRLWCKRDDLYTQVPGTALQGNKVRKLEGFLRAALGAPVPPVLVSFGGAYSNHLSALATAGKRYGIQVHLVVRGEEVDNPVLRQAEMDGARLEKISRSEYRMRNDNTWLVNLKNKVASAYNCAVENVWLIPEGGTSPQSARTVGSLYGEIVTALGKPPDFLCLSAGTGGSAAGIIQAADPASQIEVYPALKGNWMRAEIKQIGKLGASGNWRCIQDYHFGGYGKYPKSWISPATGLGARADIGEPGLPPLEPIYTAKLFYGVLDRLRKRRYPEGADLVIIHTGGIY